MASQDMTLTSSDEEVSDFCHLCKAKFDQPRVLSCLHVFCQECLTKKMPENGIFHSIIDCPDCGQETKVKYFLYLF